MGSILGQQKWWEIKFCNVYGRCDLFPCLFGLCHSVLLHSTYCSSKLDKLYASFHYHYYCNLVKLMGSRRPVIIIMVFMNFNLSDSEPMCNGPDLLSDSVVRSDRLLRETCGEGQWNRISCIEFLPSRRTESDSSSGSLASWTLRYRFAHVV